MPTYIRLITSRQRHHVGARSKDHAIDKKAAEERRDLVVVPFRPPLSPSPNRNLSLKSFEFRRGVNGEWIQCTDREEFGRYLDAEAAARAAFIRKTSRKGKPILMKTLAGTPIEDLVVNWSPWQSDWAERGFVKGSRGALLAKIQIAWLNEVLRTLDGKRHVLGFAFHADTDDPHFDVPLSRQDGRGGRIGKPGLGLAGPWTVGVDRQLRAGAAISELKRSQFAANMENFRRRYGADAVPLDVALARALDRVAREIIGPSLDVWMKRYAALVPDREAAYHRAALERIDFCRAELMRRNAHLAEPPSSPSDKYSGRKPSEPDRT